SVSGRQAEAYCVWKQFWINRYFVRNGISLRAEVTLPTLQESASLPKVKPTITIPEASPDWWFISNSTYREFLDWVQDSIFRRTVAENGYYDEYSWYAYDDSEPQHGGPLIWDNKIDLKPKHYLGQRTILNEFFIDSSENYWLYGLIHPKFLYYNYTIIDYEKASAYGPYILREMDGSKEPEYYYYPVLNDYDDPNGKDLNLSRVNALVFNDGYRTHSDRRMVFDWHEIGVYPGFYCENVTFFGRNPDCDGDVCIPHKAECFKDTASFPERYNFKDCSKCAVKICWSQAQAYYDWYLNHSQKQKWHGKATERFLLPSKEQWEEA